MGKRGRPRKHFHYIFSPEAIEQYRSLAILALPILQEICRRMRHPCFTYVPDDHPDRNQVAFHAAMALIRLLYGGNQSGKSKAAANEIKWWLTETHPYRETPAAPHVYCLSASYRTIQQGIFKHLVQILPEWEIAARGPLIPGGWQIPMWIRMKKGGMIDFISGEGKEDARRKVQAAEVDLAVVDEEIDQLLWEELQARRLSREGHVIVSATLNRGEEWCALLEERAEGGDPEVHLTRLSTYVARDRGHVSARIVREMETSLPESEQKVRLLGQSRKGEARIYPEFGPHCICEPFPIPKDWTRYVAFDPGYHTFAVLFAAVAPDGKYYLYREIYEHAAHYRTIANMFYAAAGYRPDENDPDLWYSVEDHTEEFEVMWIDGSAFGHQESGEEKTGNLLSRDCGLDLMPTRGGVEAGIELCRGSLIPGLDQLPRMRVFRTCQHFIKEIVSYRRPKDSRDPSRPEPGPKPIKRKDHLMDAWRYLELGGLDYVAPEDPFYARRRERAKAPQIPGATKSFQRTVDEHWERLMERQRSGDPIPAHPTGIGSEY